MAEHAHVIRITSFLAAADRRDDLINALRPVAQQASTAEGCFGAQVCQVTEEANTVALVSRWGDEAALQAFFAGSEEGLRAATEAAAASAAPTVHYVTLRS